MAVSRNGQIIKLSADNDTVNEKLRIQTIYAEAAALLTDANGNVLAETKGEAEVEFPVGIIVDGVKVTSTTDDIYIYTT
jgi:hypothetical protein